VPAERGPAFARALWRIAAANVTAGNQIRLYSDGDETFDAMIEIIDRAESHVELESYIYKPDLVGKRFADALAAAAKRGVKARLLTDWVGMRGTPASFMRALRARGVEVRVFNPPHWRPWFGIVPRDHRKLVVGDGKVGITGGIGIGEEWQHGIIRKRRQEWRDTCVRIIGPAAADLSGSFEGMWLRAAGIKPSRSEKLLTKTARGAELDPAHCQPTLVGIVEGEPFRLRVGRSMQLQALSARRSIWIASAYFVPSFAEIEALTGAARDGVDVRLLVPSKYDHPWIHRLTRQYYNRLLRNGVRVWEWSGEMMHAKTTVVDGRWTRVGSTDFNPLSIAINYELDAMIEDAAIGEEAEQMFESDLALSREVTSRYPTR
jgi:cardiolipin synthase